MTRDSRNGASFVRAGGLIALLLLGSLTGCSVPMREHRIADGGRAEHVRLRKLPAQGAVHQLSLFCRARIRNGAATLTLMLDGAPYQVYSLENDLRQGRTGDWYHDEAEVLYQPASGTIATVTIEYQFGSK